VTKPDRSPWRILWFATAVVVFVFVPVVLAERDLSLFVSLFLVTPALIILSLVWIIGLVLADVRYRQRWLRPKFTALLILWAVAMFLFVRNREHPFEFRETARWMVYSRKYKSEVLSRPPYGKTELKYIEWDGSGFAGVANDTMYLVFDPQDALSTAALHQPPISISGIPCAVRGVRRLEAHWYAVLFYTDELWGRGGCTVAPAAAAIVSVGSNS
jgi:amino acid transporter